MFTAALFIITRIWKHPKCPSTEERIKMWGVVCVCAHAHTHNGIFLSHKKEQNWVIYRDINGPRDSHQSDISQKEKNRCHLFTHICGI